MSLAQVNGDKKQKYLYQHNETELGRSKMPKKHYPKGLDNRMRDQNGEIRKKRSDTKVETLRKEYGDDFAKGYRSDARLGTVLKKEKADSLDQLLKKK